MCVFLREVIHPVSGCDRCDWRRRLGWEAATERCLDAGSIGEDEWPTRLSAAQEAVLWGTYNTFTGARHGLRLLVATNAAPMLTVCTSELM